MSPKNCSAILSPCWIGSSPRRRRSDEGTGVKGESERVTSDACSAVDDRGARECGKRGKALKATAKTLPSTSHGAFATVTPNNLSKRIEYPMPK